MNNDLEKYLVQKAAATGSPIKATLELTPACNMNCKMCYIRRSANEIMREGGTRDLNYWKSLMPTLRDMGVLFIALIGGEPLLYNGIDELYRSLYTNGFHINITTNGTLLANGIPEWMIQMPPRYVTVSLYGASNASYEKVTGNPLGFTQTISGIEHLKDAGIPVKLNYVCLPENKDDLEEIFRIKDKYETLINATSYCFPQIRRNISDSYERFLPDECAQMELKIRQLRDPESYSDYIKYLSEDNYDQNTIQHCDHSTCHAGRSTFWITWQGHLLPCGMMNQICIPTEPNHLVDHWNQLKKIVKETRTSTACATCSKREICSVCPAMMEAETGHLNGTPEYVCKVTDQMIMLSKAQSGIRYG